VHDPLADSAECEHEYGIALTPWESLPQASAIVAAVAHRDYLEMGVPGLLVKLVKGGVFVDVKSCYDEAELASAGANTWRL
jgi:UDP-N-acetyl-D-galactosamine dehydrogenase